jgi:5-methyltetrahydrofolate--homocysteine methyltransferase
VIIGTVSGDLHDIGRKIVASMLQGNGFEVIDLGIDVDPEKFVEAVRDSDAQILGLSALLTSTMPMMEETIKALEKAGLRQKVKVMVGGASVTQAYADRIGADGYGADAVAAVEKARALISTQSH